MSGKSKYAQLSGAGGGSCRGSKKTGQTATEFARPCSRPPGNTRPFRGSNSCIGQKSQTRLPTLSRKSSVLCAGRSFRVGILERAAEPLEIALKYASVDPDGGEDEVIERELIFASIWFFNLHHNKLTAHVSRIVRQNVADDEIKTWIRLQWDISF